MGLMPSSTDGKLESTERQNTMIILVFVKDLLTIRK